MKVVRILNTEFTDTHSIDYRADGLLSIEVEPDLLLEQQGTVPPFIEKSKDEPGYVLLDADGIAALRRILNSIPE